MTDKTTAPVSAIKKVGDREILRIPIFKDELTTLGIYSAMELKTALTKVRTVLGLAERYKRGSELATVKKLINKDLTPEQIEAIKRIANPQ